MFKKKREFCYYFDKTVFMRFNKFFLFILASSSFCTAAFTSAATTTPIASKLSIGVINSIKQKIQRTREELGRLVHNHYEVMEKFDQFSMQLEKASFSNDNVQRILKALVFSAQKHQMQTRKNPEQTPYIVHPLGVAEQLIRIGNVHQPDVIIAALLHDTVEDTNTSFQEIRKKFGVRVEKLVREVTDDKNLEKDERKRLQIAHAPEKSEGAAQIKLSDKLYNLNDLLTHPPLDWTKERIDAYFSWAKQVCDRLPSVNAPLKIAVDQVIETYWQKSQQIASENN